MARKILQGKVVSDKGDKTIIVKVDRRFKHPLLKKIVRSSKNYAAHDENNQCITGDEVMIIESRPISKTKTWSLLNKVKNS